MRTPPFSSSPSRTWTPNGTYCIKRTVTGRGDSYNGYVGTSPPQQPLDALSELSFRRAERRAVPGSPSLPLGHRYAQRTAIRPQEKRLDFTHGVMAAAAERVAFCLAEFDRGKPTIFAGPTLFEVAWDGAGSTVQLVSRNTLEAVDKSGIIDQAFRNLNGHNLPYEDYKNRVVVAAVFDSGMVGFVNKSFAERMLLYMDRERSSRAMGMILSDCVPGNYKLMQTLLTWGANPNCISIDDGYLPMENAIHHNDVEAVRLLLGAGADVAAIGGAGVDMRIFAAQHSRDVIRTMLEAHARSIAAPGQTAAHFGQMPRA